MENCSWTDENCPLRTARFRLFAKMSPVNVTFSNKYHLIILSFLLQLKYLEKDEFKDVPRLTRIKLDGNQLSVVIDHLFEAQKGLEYLGSNKIKKENNGRKYENKEWEEDEQKKMSLLFAWKRRYVIDTFNFRFCFDYFMTVLASMKIWCIYSAEQGAQYFRSVNKQNNKCIHLYWCVSWIDLSRNRLAKVTNGAFVNLSNLTYLDLSYNKLVKLEQISVTPLKRLRALNISGNIQMDLYEIGDTFQVRHTKKNFSISLCDILEFQRSFVISKEHWANQKEMYSNPSWQK